MPIKYIGRTTDFKGKTLWEILGNLKNGGVGRIVVRQMFERYPEPSFMKILKVDALPNEEVRKVKVLVERTFRGVKYEKPIQVMSTSYKADYRLLSKAEEAAYCRVEKERPKPVLPREAEFPSLYKQIFLRDMKAKETPVSEDTKLQLHYKICQTNHYTIAGEGETPSFDIQPGPGKTCSPRLYQNITK